MPQVPLTSDTVLDLSDGYARRILDNAIGQVYTDLLERGYDGKPRKLTLLIEFKMDKDQVEIVPKVKVSVPDQVPYKTVAKLNEKAGGLIFNTGNAANPDQLTIADVPAEDAGR